MNTKRKSSTKLFRINLTLEMAYKAREFKILRMDYKKSDDDINDILNKIKYNYDSTIVPLKQSLEAYNKDRVLTDNSHNYIAESTSTCESLIKQSSQMVNLIKVLNEGQYLKDLYSINQLYDSKATIIEEIAKYHNMKYIDQQKFETNETMTCTSIDTYDIKTNSTL